MIYGTKSIRLTVNTFSRILEVTTPTKITTTMTE